MHDEKSHENDLSKGLKIKERTAIEKVVTVNPNAKTVDIRRGASAMLKHEDSQAKPIIPNNKTLGRIIEKSKIDAVKENTGGIALRCNAGELEPRLR